MASIRDRFEKKVDRSGACHLWTASVGTAGYGQIGIQGRPRGAHVVAWELERGPVPPGCCVCHRCDVKLCVRFDHLFLGTQAENLDDMAQKGRRVEGDHRGTLNGRAKLTDARVRAIRGSRLSTLELAEKHKISPSSVRNVRAGKTWRHVVP